MKKVLLTLSLVAMCLGVAAIPAKRGIWKTITTADGSEVKVQLVGDEHAHYWLSTDGTAYQQAADDGTFKMVDAKAIEEKAAERRQRINAVRAKRLPQKAAITNTTYIGQKKGLILLVNFNGKSFKASNDKALFERIVNEEGYSEGYFKGSMRDYFMAQSGGLFELDFDVLGPFTVSKAYSYYGSNDSQGNDKYPATMVIEAVNQAKDLVEDWSQYDWDNDGYIDQIYIIYAGYGEADSDDTKCIWPHSYTLSYGKMYGDGTGPVTVGNNLKVDTYACGSELQGAYSAHPGSVDGIGTMCHEFSHCLGYPDFYDTNYSGGQGMGNWDIMDQGCNNGDRYQPAGYTSYERWEAGWMEPIVLEETDVNVTGMKALQNGGESYIVYNKANRNEYYLLENRQKTGWDASLPGKGLLIIHVDYNADAWANNLPNDDPSHQRMTWIAADNNYQYYMYSGTKYYTEEGMKNDPFPYGSVNAFNKATTPAAKLYNYNSDRTKYLSSSIEDITQNADGTISFKFFATYGSTTDPVDPVDPELPEGVLFYESFDKCNGTGGNDGLWNGNIANRADGFIPDYAGWEAEKAFGANQCAKFGTSTVAGSATTPVIKFNGLAKLTFKAGAWNAQKDGTELTLTIPSAVSHIDPATVTMTKGEFNEFEAYIESYEELPIIFEATSGRFFLDEVLVANAETTAITDMPRTSASGSAAWYTLDGRNAGTDFNALRPGIYVREGRKVIK